MWACWTEDFARYFNWISNEISLFSLLRRHRHRLSGGFSSENKRALRPTRKIEWNETENMKTKSKFPLSSSSSVPQPDIIQRLQDSPCSGISVSDLSAKLFFLLLQCEQTLLSSPKWNLYMLNVYFPLIPQKKWKKQQHKIVRRLSLSRYRTTNNRRRQFEAWASPKSESCEYVHVDVADLSLACCSASLFQWDFSDSGCVLRWKM